MIVIDIPSRTISLDVSEEELLIRRNEMEAKGKMAWKPLSRDRKISRALKAYASMVSSADKGAVRLLED